MDRWRRGGAALALALLAGTGPAAAGEAQDRLFATGVFEGVATGARLVYAHERTGGAVTPPALAPIAGGVVEIAVRDSTMTEGRDAEVSLREGTRLRKLNPFPASAGNPLLMVFMETSVRSMAAATGGSPFYIRNRMRDALRSQDEGTPVAIEVAGVAAKGVRYSFRPFDADPNAARMGAFAGLEINIVLSDAVPGGYAALETVAGPDASGAPALREAMTFQRMEADG